MTIWTEAERRAWSPPEKLTPAEWSERNRFLPSSVAAESGKFRLTRTPYLRGILDAAVEPLIEEIVFLKSTQVGWSTATENLVGYWIDQDPGPCLLVLPTEQAASEVIEERIRPLIQTSEALRLHQTSNAHDDTKQGIRFDSMHLFMGWANSPASLARRAVRYVIFDEVDKFPRFSGREADPISLGKERTATFMHRRRILIGSTPTTRHGAIWRAWESSGDKRRYHVPCPFCQKYQPLIFGQVKWLKIAGDDRFKVADEIELRSLAWYECQFCKARIEESQKPRMLALGLWVSEGQRVENGQLIGPRPQAKRVGFWINAIYSPWKSFSAIAAEFVRSKDDSARLQNFRNSWLAEPFEEQVASLDGGALRKRLEEQRETGKLPIAGTVPKWAAALLTTVDVQKDHFYLVIRAWGKELKSQLVAHGTFTSFEQIVAFGLDKGFPIEGTDELMQPSALIIDAGYRTDEVYEFAQNDERVMPIKGASQKQQATVKFNQGGKDFGVLARTIDTTFFKDRLANYQQQADKWLLNDAVDNEYLLHLSSEQKVIVKGEAVWQPISEGTPNHYLDCEVYQFAGADIIRANFFPSEQEIEQHRLQVRRLADQKQQKQQQLSRPQRPEPKQWLGKTGNWLNK